MRFQISLPMSSRPKYWPCSMLIMTTSPSTSAVRTEGLREMIVESTMSAIAFALSGAPSVALVWCVYHSLTGSPPRSLQLSIAAFDPAHEPPDMDTACQHQAVFEAVFLRRLFVLGPFGHQALQPRQIEQPARQRRGFKALDIACDVGASGLERTEPGRSVH